MPAPTDIAAAVLAVLSGISTWWASRERRRRLRMEAQEAARDAREDGLMGALRGQAQIYGALAALRDDIGADRVLLMVAHNGGHRIRQVGTRCYVSVLAEVATEDTPLVLRDYDARRVTRDYLGLLLDLERDKVIRYTVGALRQPEHDHLRQIYDRDGLRCALKYEVGVAKGRYWYLSAAYRDERDFVQGEVETMARAARQLHDILTLDVLASLDSGDDIRE